MPFPWDLTAPPVSGLVTPVPIDPTGRAGPTRSLAAGPHWRRTSPGRFVPRRVRDDLVEQRILEAYCPGLRRVVTGWPALRLLGGGWFDGLAGDGRTRLPVLVANNGDRLRPRPGVLVVKDTVPDDEIVVVHGIRCASPERAVFDELRRLGVHRLRDMVVVVDMACAGQLTSIARLRRYFACRRWFRDVRIVSESLAMAAEGSRSGPESRFRMVWEYDAGWGRPLLNREVLGADGRLLGIPDLLDPERGVVGEFAGGGHRDPDQHAHDIAREAAFRGAGLEYVEVVNRDFRYRPGILRRMAEAEERARHQPRAWILGPEPECSLDELLDARDASRDPNGTLSTVENLSLGTLDARR